MRSRLLILTSLVALAAIVLVVGVTVAGAGKSDPLPSVTAPDLLAKMAQAKDVTAVSGDVAWHNGLFGDLGPADAAWATCPHSRRSRATAPAASG